MITYVYGDLYFSPARVLVNPVNTTGAMGTGHSAEFKRLYPAMYDTYRDLCQQDRFEVGQLYLYRTAHKWILNLPTRKHYRADANLDMIEAGLQKFAAIYADEGLTSVSFPDLTDDAPHLSWEQDLRPLIESYLGTLPIMVYVHRQLDDNPYPLPQTSARALRNWLNGQPRQIPFDRWWRDLQQVITGTADFSTVTDGERFRVTVTDHRISLKILVPTQKPVFISETLLRDLWQYVARAGYVLPQNLPGGLEQVAPYLVALLSQLETIYPIYLAPADGQRVTGLHYIPPLQRTAHEQTLTQTGAMTHDG